MSTSYSHFIRRLRKTKHMAAGIATRTPINPTQAKTASKNTPRVFTKVENFNIMLRPN